MTDQPTELRDAARPPIADRAAFQSELDRLRVREKAHTREGDAIAAARRRLPMVEVDPRTPLIGADGPVPLIAIFGRQAGVLGGLARVLAAAVGHERGTVSARRPPDRPVVTHQGRTPRRPRLLCK